MIMSFYRGSVLQLFAQYCFAAHDLSSKHNESAADKTAHRCISSPQCCTVYKYHYVTTVLLLSKLSHFIVVRVCTCLCVPQYTTVPLAYRYTSGRDSALVSWWQEEQEPLRRESSRHASYPDHLLTNTWQYSINWKSLSTLVLLHLTGCLDCIHIFTCIHDHQVYFDSVFWS